MRAQVVVSLLTALLALVALPCAQADEASNYYKQGRKAERQGKMAEAYLLYSKAAALAPKKKIYWLRSQAVRTRAASQAKFELPPSSDVTSDTAAAIPGDEEESDPVTERDLREARRPLPPTELKASPESQDFDLRLEPRPLFLEVAKAYGLDVVFDGDYPDSGEKVVFRMQQATYREALRALETVTGSFIVPLGERLFLAVKDTPQKRNDAEPAVTVVVPIPQTVTVQEAQELARAVQQVMEIKRFGVDSARRLVLLNGPVSKVRPAQRLFEQLSGYKPEVSVDVEFIEASRNDVLSYGFSLPTSFPIVPLTTVLHNLPSLSSGLSYFLFGGGQTAFAVGVSTATLAANFNRSKSRLMLKTTVRSTDGMPASFHVGQKYPILTSGYFGPTSSSSTGVYTPPPSISFEDLGLVMKVTPKVQGEDDVTLDLEAEFKVLTGASVNGIPVIASRKLTSKVQLKEGESALVSGVMSLSEARSISGVAGLSQIPGLGWLTTQHDNTLTGDEVIIVIRPHLLHSPPDSNLSGPLWVGTESRPLQPL
jgi:general secretion pathway protein D